ncbi:hypothetical protein [Streptomyces sp. NPDC005907]|uniref:hypothetical protein n=1 Tax=Streptomyces sp. NPDC005907 TaxID=3154571 RepID=UPI00340EFD62
MADTAEATRPAGTARAARMPAPGGVQDGAPLWTRPARGRHRRPRPRRALVAVGGLALAAGALSLVRPAHDPLGGGTGSAEAGPRGSGTADGPAGGTTATVVPAPPTGAASATAVMGGAGPTPTSGATVVPPPTAGTPSPSRPADPATARTGIPEAPADPVTPKPPAPSRPPAASSAPRPAPGRSTHAPAPAPDPRPDGPGLCVPLIGLCVDPLAGLPRPGG